MVSLIIPHAEEGNALSRFPLFCSNDLEETREQVARVFCPHELRIAEKNKHVNARMSHAPIGEISLNRLQYGADVRIDPGCLKDFLLVQMPISGTAEITCGSVSVLSNSDQATVITPTLPVKMLWRACCDQLMVRIPRTELERHCAHHLGHELRRPIEFQLGMDMSQGGVDDWRRLVAFLVAEVDQDHSVILDSPLVRAQLTQIVIATLLLCQPNNYRETLLRPAPPIAPYYVKRVEEYIAANADQPLTIVELAAYAGVSIRSLFAGFRNFRGTSPIAYLRSVRLQRAQEDLIAAERHETVTNIAVRWGFTHLGRFTAAYKRKFGELPSETLQRDQ